MNSKARIASILQASHLGEAITGIPTFDLATVGAVADTVADLPDNLRLGHLVERVVSQLLHASKRYRVVYENVQLMDESRTIGEIDFVIEDLASRQIIHIELAYKFYLYDPTIGQSDVDRWIGPNRNDTLQKKLQKLRDVQLPLLYNRLAAAHLSAVSIPEVVQSLCLLVALFVPYGYAGSMRSAYSNAVKGYYLGIEAFLQLDDSEKEYYIPLKREWGMDPADHLQWGGLAVVADSIKGSIAERRSVLCWQKSGEFYTTIFVVWW